MGRGDKRAKCKGREGEGRVPCGKEYDMFQLLDPKVGIVPEKLELSEGATAISSRHSKIRRPDTHPSRHSDTHPSRCPDVQRQASNAMANRL